MAASVRFKRRQREPGRTGSGCSCERLESDATGARSDGDDNSFGGETVGGVAIGADGDNIGGGAARPGIVIAGAGGIGRGATGGGADWARANITAHNVSSTLRIIGNGLTAGISQVQMLRHPHAPLTRFAANDAFTALL